jgi:hypothetical protein
MHTQKEEVVNVFGIGKLCERSWIFSMILTLLAIGLTLFLGGNPVKLYEDSIIKFLGYLK